ncbi:MAG TPA: paraquat-inducible protein A [Acetobacteraceae bacterium]|nr:paraquat-inducible protein A [Acetobacteraceae bacterium]
MPTLIACRDCGAIQHLPAVPLRGRLECWRCGRVLESVSGRSLDAALACALATLLLLIPANVMTLMTVHKDGISVSTHLAAGLATSWRQGWPLLTIVLGLQGVILPFLRFGLLSVTLGALRLGWRGRWLGPAFRWSERLDIWAMADVVLIGAGIGYGRVASQIPTRIDIGGWCLVGAALMTMVTRACLERRAVWRMVQPASKRAPRGALACTSCDLVLPPDAEGQRCPRCAARVYRRRPNSMVQSAALVTACWALMPIAYGFPMSEFWEAGTPHPHTIVNGVELLLEHGFWPFAVLIFTVSIVFPFTKLIGLSWFLLSVRCGWHRRLRFKTRLYRFIDEIGRWSNLDPFTVMIFAPIIQLGQLAHIDILGGSPAFLSTVVLATIAARAFDPRLLWDTAAPAPMRVVESPAAVRPAQA